MSPLPALKFFLLAVRQISKPIVKATVMRAQQNATVTRAVCLGLGRFSLGVMCVVAKWTADERRPRHSVSSTTKTEQNETEKAAGSSSSSPLSSSAAGSGSGAGVLYVAPRSRSLLDAAEDLGGVESKSGRGGGLLFYRRPVQSTWQAFSTAFFTPFSEENLVSAGAELLIEMLVYTILALALFFELSTASKASEAKEHHMIQRIDALERKVNELIQDHHADAVEVLTSTEPVVVSRTSRLLNGINRVVHWTSRE